MRNSFPQTNVRCYSGYCRSTKLQNQNCYFWRSISTTTSTFHSLQLHTKYARENLVRFQCFFFLRSRGPHSPGSSINAITSTIKDRLKLMLLPPIIELERELNIFKSCQRFHNLFAASIDKRWGWNFRVENFLLHMKRDLAAPIYRKNWTHYDKLVPHSPQYVYANLSRNVKLAKGKMYFVYVCPETVQKVKLAFQIQRNLFPPFFQTPCCSAGYLNKIYFITQHKKLFENWQFFVATGKSAKANSRAGWVLPAMTFGVNLSYSFVHVWVSIPAHGQM